MNFFTRLAKQHTHHGTYVAQVRLWHVVASVEQALHPHLRSVPFAVVDTPLPGGRVLDANEVALAVGVRAGTPVDRLRRRFPHIHIRPSSPERLQGFTRAFAALAKRWGRVTGVSADGQTATVIIPAVSALERAAVFLHIQEACWQELECNVVVGVGPTVAFANLAAGACVEPGFRFLDRQEQASLNTLPVSLIPGIGRRTARALVQYGVPTVWHFLTLTPDEVTALGGPTLLRLYRQYMPVAALPFNENSLPTAVPVPAALATTS